jgi:phage terminase small subunit
VVVARAPDELVNKAYELYKSGMKLVAIASQLNIPDGTVRRWKSTYKWDSERSDNKSERSEKNKNVNKNKPEPIADEVEEVLNNTDLTDKQRLFCLYYSKSFNATRSYMKAYGCDEYTGMANGSRLLSKAKIKEEILRLKQERMNREFISEHDIFQKYMDIAFADITDFLEFGQEEVPVMGPFGPIKDEETKETITRVVNTVRFKESYTVDGTIISEVKQGKDGASIKLADRMRALDWLTTHMDIATEEQKARIALLKAKANSGSSSDSENQVADILRGLTDGIND